jgi:hypothetical protein
LAIAGLGVVGFFALSASVELAVKYGLTNASGAIDTRVACHETERPCEASAAWKQSEEWLVLRDAIKKDAVLINKIAAQTGQRIFYLNDNPTAENIAKFLFEKVCPKLFEDKNVKCSAIKLYETPNCYVEIK